MKNTVIYILGATVLVGGAYLFLKNKKAKDLAKLDEIGGTTPSGTTPSGTTSGGTTSGDGVAPTDANLNLANATILATQRKTLVAQTKPNLSLSSGNLFGGGLFGGGNPMTTGQVGANPQVSIQSAKIRLAELDKKLATLGYKVDAIGQLVKI
jgi:hypothetical protein